MNPTPTPPTAASVRYERTNEYRVPLPGELHETPNCGPLTAPLDKPISGPRWILRRIDPAPATPPLPPTTGDWAMVKARDLMSRYELRPIAHGLLTADIAAALLEAQRGPGVGKVSDTALLDTERATYVEGLNRLQEKVNEQEGTIRELRVGAASDASTLATLRKLIAVLTTPSPAPAQAEAKPACTCGYDHATDDEHKPWCGGPEPKLADEVMPPSYWCTKCRTEVTASEAILLTPGGVRHRACDCSVEPYRPTKPQPADGWNPVGGTRCVQQSHGYLGYWAFPAGSNVGLFFDANCPSGKPAHSTFAELDRMRHMYPPISVEQANAIRAAWPKPSEPMPARGVVDHAAEMGECGIVTHDEATEIALKFINQHFKNSGHERPRTCIPADPRRDDDLRLLAYIRQQARANTDAAGVSTNAH